MKQMYTKLLVALALFLVPTLGNAQEVNDDYNPKFSDTTIEFLEAQKNNTVPQKGIARAQKRGNNVERVDGFIYLYDMSQTDEVEALGVRILEKFKKFLCVEIPVNAFEKLAALENVKLIRVSEAAEEETDKAQADTNADDVYEFSEDAQAAGLEHMYDGNGVVIALIDGGVDFNHPAFKNEDGTSRVVAVYRDITDDDGNTSLQFLTGETLTAALDTMTADMFTSSHGSHTASIAAGSKVIVEKNYVNYFLNKTASVDTLHGMAPKADIILCALKGSYTEARIQAAMKKAVAYADSVGKPIVMSVSLGSMGGMHDGTGSRPDVTYELFEDQPGHIYCNSSGNYAGGQNYAMGQLSQENPIYVMVSRPDTVLYDMYSYHIVRSGINTYKAKFMIVDTESNTVVWDGDWMTKSTTSYTTTSTDANGVALSDFVSSISTLKFNRYVESTYSGKYYVKFTADMKFSDKKYRPCIGFILTDEGSGEDYLDNYIVDNFDVYDFQTYTGLSDYNFLEGTDYDCANNASTDWNAISVGNYVTRKKITIARYQSAKDNYGLTTYTYKKDEGDIAISSSYRKSGYGAARQDQKIPTIGAPGTYLVAAFNRYDTKTLRLDGTKSSSAPVTPANSRFDLSYGVYGTMSGTSMACPAAAGIIALWLQACPTLTTAGVKDVLEQTSRTDSYTEADPDRFGYGKIDALAGIKYLLESDQYDTTGITEINASNPCFDGKIYDLNGRVISISQYNLPKGIYIKDGKKFVVK